MPWGRDPLEAMDPERRARFRAMLQRNGSFSSAAQEPMGAVQGGQAGNANLDAILAWFSGTQPMQPAAGLDVQQSAPPPSDRFQFAPEIGQSHDAANAAALPVSRKSTIAAGPLAPALQALDQPPPSSDKFQLASEVGQSHDAANATAAPLPGEDTPEEKAYIRRNALPGIAAGLANLGPNPTIGQVLNGALSGYLGGMGQAKQQLRQERRQDMLDANVTLGNALKLDEIKRKQAALDAANAQIDEIAKTDPEKAKNLRIMLGNDPSGLSDALFPKNESKVLAPGAVLVDGEGKTIATGPEQTMTPYQQAALGLQRERLAWDKAHPSAGSQPETWQTLSPDDTAKLGFAPGTVVTRSSRGQVQVEQQPKGGGGIQITGYDDAGRPLIQVGGEGPAQQPQQGNISLTTPTVNKVQPEIIGMQDQLARINQIGAGFKPEYQQFGQRANNWWTAAKEKMGIQPSPEDKQMLTDYTKYRSDAVANLNAVLKEQSGAAVTPQEYERLKAASPNAGTGVFDGDSPTEFQAKIGSTQNQLKMAIARRAYLMTKGIPFDIKKGNTGGVSLDQMPAIIDAEGSKIEQELVAKGVPPAEAEKQALAQLKQTYGI